MGADEDQGTIGSVNVIDLDAKPLAYQYWNALLLELEERGAKEFDYHELHVLLRKEPKIISEYGFPSRYQVEQQLVLSTESGQVSFQVGSDILSIHLSEDLEGKLIGDIPETQREALYKPVEYICDILGFPRRENQ